MRDAKKLMLVLPRAFNTRTHSLLWILMLDPSLDLSISAQKKACILFFPGLYFSIVLTSGTKPKSVTDGHD